MILVVGATGIVGGQVCEGLAASGESVRAMVRTTSNPEKVSALRAQGVEVVEGDLRDPAALDAACAGVDAVICTVSAMPFSYEPGVNDIQTTDLDGVTSLVDLGLPVMMADVDIRLRESFEEVFGPTVRDEGAASPEARA